MLLCNEMFTIGCSMMSLVFREVIQNINIAFWKLIVWHVDRKMETTMNEFKTWCGLFNV